MRIKSVGNPILPNALLWRYFDFQKFLSFVIEQSVFFNRMDAMEDANEGISINQLLIKYGDEIEKKIANRNRKISAKNELPLKLRQQKYFISCWLIHHRESVAMWNSYSDSDGIALRINAGQLIDAITKKSELKKDEDKMKTLYHGPVVYKDFLNPQDRLRFKEEVDIIGFQKDESFEHEKEYRFLIKQDLHNFSAEEIPFIKLKLNDFTKLKFDLIYHPKMESWKKENIKNVIKALKAKNFTLKDSELELKSW